MAYFAAVLTYGEDAERRQEVRPKHREYLRGKLESGKVLMAGPFGDDSGAIIIYQAEDISEVQEMLTNDPFAQNGVIVDSTIKPWKIVMAQDENLVS